MSDALTRALSRKWFYEFELPNGMRTETYLPPDLATIHDTRLAMIRSVLEPLFGDTWADTTCLDLACHEGFFATHVAQRGCRDVLGIDVRPEHIEHAALIRDIHGLSNLRFAERDVRTLGAGELGDFDIVLMLGLIYHLENPVGALRLARSHCRGVCIVETQLAPGTTGVIDWGSRRSVKPMVGSFAVIDETDELATGNREANTGIISLVPSLDALLYVMRAVGFDRVEVIRPGDGGNEQLVAGKRALVAAYVH